MDQVKVLIFRPRSLTMDRIKRRVSFFLFRIMYQRRLSKIFSKNTLRYRREAPHDSDLGRAASVQCLLDGASWSGQWPCRTNLGAFMMLWSRWLMSWSEPCCPHSLGSYACKKGWLPKIDICPESASPKSLIGPHWGFLLVPQPFKNQSLFERGGTRADWLVKIGERNATIATICYIDNGERILIATSQ